MQLKWALMAVALCHSIAAANAANMVVIASNSKDMAVGTIIDGTEELALKPGTTVTLVLENGKIIELSGPFEGQADGSSTGSTGSLIEALSRLLTTDSESSESLATWRAGEFAEPSDPWSLNATRPGSYCLLSGGPAFLWRPLMDTATVLRLETISGGQDSAKIDWPAGERVLAWPSS